MDTRIPRPVTPRIEPTSAPSPLLQRLVDSGTRTPEGGPLNIFGTLDLHTKLHEKFMVFAGYLLNGAIPGREREIVILRVGWNCRSIYEFGQHTIIGRREGLSDAEIGALTLEMAAHNWSRDDAALIAMADELCSDDCISEGTWQRLSVRWDEKELMELILVAGSYRMVSGFLNSVGVQRDTGVPGWPEL